MQTKEKITLLSRESLKTIRKQQIEIEILNESLNLKDEEIANLNVLLQNLVYYSEIQSFQYNNLINYIIKDKLNIDITQVDLTETDSPLSAVNQVYEFMKTNKINYVGSQIDVLTELTKDPSIPDEVKESTKKGLKLYKRLV